MRRIASYQGMSWPMGGLEPQVFLDEVLCSQFPDLRGARFTVRVDEARQEEIYTYTKCGGEKGQN